MTITYPIVPVPKPRMTRSDKWKKRACVVRYYAFKDAVKEHGVVLPVPYKVTFYIQIPKSWSKKKKALMEGRAHTQKPDKDNLEKALLDAIYKDDSEVWSGWAEKRWSNNPRIEVEPI